MIVKSQKRREMFGDLYRLAEYCEDPPFQPGDIYGNYAWFDKTTKEQLMPFLDKYKDIPLAADLAMAIYTEADRKAAEINEG